MLSFYNPAKVLLYMKELEEKKPVFMELHPSNACNHQCVWCRYTQSAGESLSLEFMLNLLGKYPNVRGVRITGGGEPLVNKYTLDFIEECGKRGINTAIETNGALLNDKRIDIIGTNCTYCRISLDAATPETYSLLHNAPNGDFHKILRHFQLLSKTKLPQLGISYLVVDDNVAEIPLLSQLGLPIAYIHFKPLIQGISQQTKRKALRNIEELQRSIKYALKFDRIIQEDFCNHTIKCEIGELIRVVSANGREYVCCEHVGEEEFERGKWNGSTEKCATCRYNPYNEIIHMYRNNAFTKEFL